MSARFDERPAAAGRGVLGPRLLVAGLGHVGLGVARDAVVAGYTITGLGAEPRQVVRLIDGLADEDETATVLAGAIESGRCTITDDAASCAGFDTAVLVPDGRPADPGERGPLELLAVALAPYVRPGALVVVGGTSSPRADGEILSATVELLSGMRAGADYDLGYALTGLLPPCGPTPVIVSGVGARAAQRTAELHRSIGRRAAPVCPVEAAEFVAVLQAALVARQKPGGPG